MARRVLPFAVAGALMLALAGCSNYERPRRPAWRGEAEAACLAQKLIHVSAYVQPAREIDGPGICGLNHPFKVSALLDGAVRFNSIYTLDCPMIAALNAWLGEIVQAYATMNKGGGALKLLNTTKRIKDLLSITKLLTVFECHDNESEAVKSFG